jgi:hypothetical protein
MAFFGERSKCGAHARPKLDLLPVLDDVVIYICVQNTKTALHMRISIEEKHKRTVTHTHTHSLVSAAAAVAAAAHSVHRLSMVTQNLSSTVCVRVCHNCVHSLSLYVSPEYSSTHAHAHTMTFGNSYEYL